MPHATVSHVTDSAEGRKVTLDEGIPTPQLAVPGYINIAHSSSCKITPLLPNNILIQEEPL